ncbi:MarR family winged helix-turn-helix transcriptional regulator [Neptunicella sp. SCSIO 80796]|uniref:MarR family winged helix-turn-helix transcriptional regulator n=1 Tax=Neptunicella plasticusilytica TaxID=3117012 RepID=UPI003A4D5088
MSSQENTLGFLMADVSRLMRRAFQLRLEGSQVTLAQARALTYVSRNEGVRQIDLAELLEVQPITLARLIDQLEQTGLVERRPAPGDRRAYQIFLTEAAAPQLEEIKRVGLEIKQFAFSDLDDQQTEQFMAALEQVRDRLNTI